MSENIRDVLSDLIDSYGINILEDPDRLSQFLEDRCAREAEEAFHLTFALRYRLPFWTRNRKNVYVSSLASPPRSRGM